MEDVKDAGTRETNQTVDTDLNLWWNVSLENEIKIKLANQVIYSLARSTWSTARDSIPNLFIKIENFLLTWRIQPASIDWNFLYSFLWTVIASSCFIPSWVACWFFFLLPNKCEGLLQPFNTSNVACLRCSEHYTVKFPDNFLNHGFQNIYLMHT